MAGGLVVLAAVTIGVVLGTRDGPDPPARSPAVATQPSPTTTAQPSSTAQPSPTSQITDAAGNNPAAASAVSISQLRTEAPGATVTLRTLTVGTAHRAYLVIAPQDQVQPLPMLLVAAGSSASTTYEVQRDGFVPLAQHRQAVLVYPVSFQESWNAGNCCGAAYRAGLDDVGFVRAVAADAQRRLPVIANRTYFLGFSNGGKLGYALQCRGPAVFAAFAVVAATPSTACATRSSGTPAPFLLGVGTSDNKELPLMTRPRPAVSEVARTAAIWRARDGCSPAPSSTRTLATATITTYAACSSPTSVQTVVYQGLPHLWPSPALVGAAAAAPLIWSFLSRHSRG